MNQPSPIITWIGVIGGLVALLRSAIDLIAMWRNRGRVVFHAISAIQYCQSWNEWDIERAWVPEGFPPLVKPGDWRRAFIVLEFDIENRFPTDASIGPFMIDD